MLCNSDVRLLESSTQSNTQVSPSSKLKTLGFALAMIAAMSIAGVGLMGFGVSQQWWSIGALSQLEQIHSIAMMATGGGFGIIFLVAGIVFQVKNHQASQNQSSQPNDSLLDSPIQNLTDDILKEILKFLEWEDLDQCRLVCRRWRPLADHEDMRIERYLRTQIMAQNWWANFYNVDHPPSALCANILFYPPSLPKDIRKTLKAYSHFWPNKRVATVSRLVWIPKNLRTNDFLNNFQWHIRDKNKNRSNKVRIPDTLRDSIVEAMDILYIPTDTSYWLLITKKEIPTSVDCTYNQLDALPSQYTPPKIFEALVNLTALFISGEKMPINQEIRTRCQETLNIPSAFPPHPIPIIDFVIVQTKIYQKNNGHDILIHYNKDNKQKAGVFAVQRFLN